MNFTRPTKNIASDDPANWPRRGSCGQCFKAILIDPTIRYINEEGKKNCDHYSATKNAYILEFRKFYKGIVRLIDNMTKFKNAYTTTSASESDQILHGLLKELVVEIRMYREVMMAIGGIASNDTTRAIPGDVLQYFTTQ
ncbi:hypothetical protein ACEPPN_017687 [Leptodophora sp. 'Broadleaf-Isolate-01']